VLSYYELAKKKAPSRHRGGVPTFGDARDSGAWIQPTLWTGLPETARTVREEIFGPCAHIAPFDQEEEAIAMANDTPYGLASTVWTTNLARGHRVGQAMEVASPGSTAGSCATCARPSRSQALGIGREGACTRSISIPSRPTFASNCERRSAC